MAGKEETTSKSKSWILYGFGASFMFTIGDTLFAEIANSAGPFVMFYNASGGIFIGLIFNIYKAYSNYKTKGVFWPEQNIIVDGKFKFKNLFAFVVFCCLIVLV